MNFVMWRRASLYFTIPNGLAPYSSRARGPHVAAYKLNRAAGSAVIGMSSDRGKLCKQEKVRAKIKISEKWS